MNLKKIFNLNNLPYIVLISLCEITTVILLSLQLFYTALFFFISSFASFFTPLFFSQPKEGNEKFSSYFIKMIIRILYITFFSIGFGLLWIYVPIFKNNIHPIILLTFPTLSLVYYFIVIIKQIIKAKRIDK